MARKKQRVIQHIMEDESFHIIKSQLPKNWVLREFNNPDYGVDLIIELFDKKDEEVSEVLNEYLYVQVKSVQTLEVKKEKIYPVNNVAKGNWDEDKSEYFDVDVVKFVLDTNSLYSVQALGASVSFILLVVDLSSKDTYFVCLNDYIDKIILPKNINYHKQGSITITIPKLNTLENKEISLSALEFYGKRAKLLSAFAKFAYQKNELNYLLGYKSSPIYTYRDEVSKEETNNEIDIKRQVLYFIEQIEYLDIWDSKSWEILGVTHQELLNLKQNLIDGKDVLSLVNDILIMWHRLTNLTNMYEELTREWFLPKYLSYMTSYPSVPESISGK